MSFLSEAYEVIGSEPRIFSPERAHEGPLTVPHSSLPEHSFEGEGVTYTLQIRLLTRSSEWTTLLHKGTVDSDRSPGVFITPGSTTIHARYSTSRDWNEGINECKGIPPSRVGTEEYTHVAIVIRRRNIKVYIDGELSDDYTGEPALENTQVLRVGKCFYGHLNAYMKCFRFYPRALTDEEITIDMQTEDVQATSGDSKEGESHEFEGLLKGTFADMKLQVGSGEDTKEFPGHKAILGGRCGYIDVIADSKFADSSLATLSFPMFQPEDFKKFLRLIYLEEFNFADNLEGNRLLNIIEFMQVKTVFLRRVSDDLVKKINLKNFASVAELVLRFGSASAQKQVKKFFVSKYNTIAKSDEFFSLSRESMKILIQHHASKAS